MPTRREAITQLGAIGLAAPALRQLRGLVPAAAPSPALALPSAAQQAWQDLELGMFVHFAPNTWQEKEYDDLSLSPGAIMPEVDAGQWADTAVTLGARYIVLVAKHTGGFCLWPTDTTDYGIRGTPWRGGRGDVMADLAAACAQRGLRLGVYLSPRDDRHGAGLSGRCATPAAQAAYDELYRTQLTELLTRYGPVTELWLDGSSVVPTGDLIARHAPNAMVFQGPQATIRWVGNEDGFAPYPCWNALAATDARTGVATALHGDPAGDVWMPVEVDVSIRRPNWFWSTANEHNLVSLDDLIEIYYRSVGRGTQLLLNLPPDRAGRIPEADARRAAQFGAEIKRRFGTPLRETAASGPSMVLGFDAPTRVDHVILEEALSRGERIRAWKLDGNAWGRWIPLGGGTAIGHKLIHPVAPEGYTALRVSVSESEGEPMLRRFAAFDTGITPPRTWRDAASLWADDAVGPWSGEALDLDLTAKVAAPGRYRLRLVAEGGAAVELRDIDLNIGTVASARLVSAVPGRRDAAFLAIPEVQPGSRVTLKARVRGAARGTILLQRW
jgi:alpha-L-fucosidase